MRRLFSFLFVLTFAAQLVSCAPQAAGQPDEVRALQNPVVTVEITEAAVVPQDPPASCPITQPSQAPFVPPAPFPAAPPERYVNQFWHGTPELWTMLETEGTWYALPENRYGYSQKVFWWSQSFDVSQDPYPPLTVTMERLDGESTPVVATEEATNASADFGTAMLTGVTIPELGCWKITGQYQKAELSFVVWVTP